MKARDYLTDMQLLAEAQTLISQVIGNYEQIKESHLKFQLHRALSLASEVTKLRDSAMRPKAKSKSLN